MRRRQAGRHRGADLPPPTDGGNCGSCTTADDAGGPSGLVERGPEPTATGRGRGRGGLTGRASRSALPRGGPDHRSRRGALAVPADRGSFTAELAAGLPALMLLLFAGLTAVNAVTTKAGCLDAAREAALAASRGESGSAAGTRYAPPGAEVSVTVAGERVIATVQVPVRALGAPLPRVTVSATAVAAVEPGAPEPQP